MHQKTKIQRKRKYFFQIDFMRVTGKILLKTISQRALLTYNIYVRGASKIKLKTVNKKRMVTVRRVIMFLNISRHPLLICLHCCLHQYKTLKAVASATAAIVC